MGYKPSRFQGDVDDNLICPLCSCVLKEPLQVNRFKTYSSRNKKNSSKTKSIYLRIFKIFFLPISVRSAKIYFVRLAYRSGSEDTPPAQWIHVESQSIPTN